MWSIPPSSPLALASPILVDVNQLREDFGDEFVAELQEDFPEHMPEELPEAYGPEFVPEWNMIADGDGNWHLTNLHYPEPEVDNFWNVNTDTIFRLFTRRNPTAGQILTVGNAGSITGSQFRTGHPTR